MPKKPDAKAALAALLDKRTPETEAAARAALGIKPPEMGPSRPVIVCTDKRGVFMGFAKDTTGDPITLERPRMVVYWSKDVKGILGLAATGPSASCRVTAAPPKIELRGITCVIEVSAEAVKAWEAAPWAS
jgi:hypothetical protein